MNLFYPTDSSIKVKVGIMMLWTKWLFWHLVFLCRLTNQMPGSHVKQPKEKDSLFSSYLQRLWNVFGWMILTFNTLSVYFNLYQLSYKLNTFVGGKKVEINAVTSVHSFLAFTLPNHLISINSSGSEYILGLLCLYSNSGPKDQLLLC